jgi:hypothetical protein
MESGETHNSSATPNTVKCYWQIKSYSIKKEAAAEQKARRDAHLLCLIEAKMWQNLENYT